MEGLRMAHDARGRSAQASVELPVSVKLGQRRTMAMARCGARSVDKPVDARLLTCTPHCWSGSCRLQTPRHASPAA
jgi:hypothetical protein